MKDSQSASISSGRAAQHIADRIKFFGKHGVYESFDQALKEIKNGSDVIYTTICKKTNEFNTDLDSWKTLKLDFNLKNLLESDVIFITLSQYVEININEVFEMLKLGKSWDIFIPTADVSLHGWNQLNQAGFCVFDQTRKDLTRFYKVVP